MVTAGIFSCDKEDISSEQTEQFIKYYTNYPEFTAADVEINGNSGYAVLGTAYTEDSGSQMCFFRTDKYGNIISKPKLYGRGNNNKAYCLKVLDNGDFAILGTSLNPETELSEGLFIYTNNEGTPLWTKVLTYEGSPVEPRYFDVNDNGRFFVTGYMDVSPDRGGRQILIMSFDQNRNYFFRYIGVEGEEEGYHLQILDDGKMLITGRARFSNSVSPVYQSYVCTVNQSGLMEEWTDIVYKQGNVVLESQGQSIQLIDQSNWIILSTVKTGISTTISLSKFNEDVDAILWQEQYTGTVSEVAQSCTIDGNTIVILGTTGTTATNKAISLLNVNISGEFESRSSFGDGTALSAMDFVKTNGGGFIIVGSNVIAGGNNTSIALIKTPGTEF